MTGETMRIELEMDIPGVNMPSTDPRDSQVIALQAENLVLRDRITNLDREIEALRQQLADLLLLRVD